MREILFRGKRLDDGKWLYGSLIAWPDGDAEILEHWSCENGVMDKSLVDPATIGQYIGKVDVNGIRIFEGDILKGAWGTVLRVEFDDSYLQYRAVDSHQHSREIDYYGKVRVIGNVYDSPELLEEVSVDA